MGRNLVSAVQMVSDLSVVRLASLETLLQRWQRCTGPIKPLQGSDTGITCLCSVLPQLEVKAVPHGSSHAAEIRLQIAPANADLDDQSRSSISQLRWNQEAGTLLCLTCLHVVEPRADYDSPRPGKQ